MPRWRILLSAALLWRPAEVCPQTTATEEQVRSAFLYQLAQFVNWPPDPAPGTPLRFCVLGNDALAESLRAVVHGKTIEGREIAVLKASRPAELTDCHLAFIGYRKQKQLAELFSKWKYPPVLMVGEGDSFVQSGGMVALGIDSGRVTFAVNLATTRQAGLALRSQLLRFARLVPSGASK